MRDELPTSPEDDLHTRGDSHGEVPPRSARWVRIGLAALAAVHGAVWWRALLWWPQLPEQIPIHFNAAGEPDRFVARSIAALFLTPAIMLSVCVILGAVALCIDKIARETPALVNVPRKDLFVRLSPERRIAVMLPTRALLVWVLTGVNLLGLGIIEGSARISVHGHGTVSIWPVVAFVAFTGVLTLTSLRATTRAIERGAREEGLA